MKRGQRIYQIEEESFLEEEDLYGLSETQGFYQKDLNLPGKDKKEKPETEDGGDLYLSGLFEDDEYETFLEGDFSPAEKKNTTIYITRQRPDLFYVNAQLTREEIAHELFGNSEKKDDFDFVHVSYVPNGGKDVILTAVKPRSYKDLISYTYGHEGGKYQKYEAWLIEYADENVEYITSLMKNDVNTSWISAQFLKWAECSEIPLESGTSAFDYFLSKTYSTKIGQKALINEVISRLREPEVERIKKAVVLRSKKFANTGIFAKYDVEDEFFFKDAPHMTSPEELKSPVIGRYYYENNASSYPITAFQRIGKPFGEPFNDSDARRMAEIQARNSPLYPKYSRAVLPVKSAFNGTFYVAVLIDIGQQGYAFKGIDINADEGNFFWYYPGTILIPAMERFNEGYDKGSIIVRDYRLSVVEVALDKAKNDKQFQNLFYLDFDVLAESFYKRTKSIHSAEYDEATKTGDISLITEMSTQLPKEIIATIINGYGKYYSSVETGDAVGLLARLFLATPKSQYPELETFMSEKGYMSKLILMARDCIFSNTDIESALYLGSIIGSNTILTASPEEVVLDESIKIKLGKDKQDNLHVIKTNLTKDQTSGSDRIVINQIKDGTTVKTSKPLSPATMLYVEILDKNAEPGKYRVEIMTAAQLAIVGEAISSHLEDEEFWENAGLIFDIILLASTILSGAALIRAIGTVTLRQIIKTGGIKALRMLLMRLAAAEVRYYTVMFAMDLWFLIVEKFADEIEELPLGKEFLALGRTVFGIIGAGQLGLLMKSGSDLLPKLLLKGQELIAALYKTGKNLIANSIVRFTNDLEARFIVARRWLDSEVAAQREYALAVINNTPIDDAAVKGMKGDFMSAVSKERILVASKTITSKLGTSIENLPSLKKIMADLKNLPDEHVEVAKQFMKNLESMTAEELPEFLNEVSRIMRKHKSARNVGDMLPLITVVSGKKISAFGSRMNGLKIVDRVASLPPGYFTHKTFSSLVSKILPKSVKPMEPKVLEWTIRRWELAFKQGDQETLEIFGKLSERSDVPWVNFYTAYTTFPWDYKLAMVANRSIRGFAGELTAEGQQIINVGRKRYKFVDNQVATEGKRLDYRLQEIMEGESFSATLADESGNLILAEVKAWTIQTWKNELNPSSAKGMVNKMVEQLKAAYRANSSEYPVLIVTSDLSKSQIKEIKLLVNNKVNIVQMPEKQILGTGNKMRSIFRAR